MSQWASEYIEKLRKGESVTFRATGRSMEPLIRSRQSVKLMPDNTSYPIHVGEVVLCEVNGYQYLHLVGAIAVIGNKRWFRIENAAGHINGWITRDKIYGWVYSVED